MYTKEEADSIIKLNSMFNSDISLSLFPVVKHELPWLLEHMTEDELDSLKTVCREIAAKKWHGLIYHYGHDPVDDIRSYYNDWSEERWWCDQVANILPLNRYKETIELHKEWTLDDSTKLSMEFLVAEAMEALMYKDYGDKSGYARAVSEVIISAFDNADEKTRSKAYKKYRRDMRSTGRDNPQAWLNIWFSCISGEL